MKLAGHVLGWCRVFGVAAGVLCAAVLGVAGLAGEARAANLVANGGFETTSIGSPGGYICAAGATCTSRVSDWSSECRNGACGGGGTPNSLLYPSTGGSAFNNGIGLWNTIHPVVNSPVGGNFIALDGDPNYNVRLWQTITGLTAGATYQLSFWQAAAQQNGTSGDTTEWFQVSFGTDPIGTGGINQVPTDPNTTTINSTVMVNPNHDFQAWNFQTMNFVANASTQVLSFMSKGTPAGGGGPPIVLLDGVSLTQVPEPATLVLLGSGMLGLFAARRRLRARGNA